MATTVGVVSFPRSLLPVPRVPELISPAPPPVQPIALGALLILDGAISGRGIVSPSSPEVWKPLLVSLDGAGIKLNEKRTVGRGRGVLEVLEKQVAA